MVLPLPLVTFEKHMLFDDRPAFPMNCFLRAHFSGRLDVPTLQVALPAVLARHPLFRARVSMVGRRQTWVACADWPTVSAFSLRDSGEWPHPTPIDVSREPGLRLSVVETEERCSLVMQFHHACCDAVGACAFLEELFTAYVQARAGAVPSLPPLDAESLRHRGRFSGLSGGVGQVIRQKSVGLLRAWRFATRTPLSIGFPSSSDPSEAVANGAPAVLSRRLSAAESLRLRQAASRQGVTLNDLLMRDWFLAVDGWKRRYVPGASRGRLRVCVPMNLRTDEHRRSPASNVISMAFVERRRENLADPDLLLQGIHEEMSMVKRLRLGQAFVVGMGLVEKLPHRLLHAIAPNRCWASGVLSNLGVVMGDAALPTRDGRLDLDGVVLEEIEALPPLRAATHAAFVVFTYAGRLCLTLHYDARAIEPSQAGDLGDGYVRQLQASMEDAAPQSSPWPEDSRR